MKVNSFTYKPFYKVSSPTHTSVIDAVDDFLMRVKKLKIDFDAVYPGDPVAFPFTLYIAEKTGIPLKTEKFLKKEDKILIVFSTIPDQIQKSGLNFLTENYLKRKLKIFRKSFPNSPALLIGSNQHMSFVDIQLLLFEKLERFNSYKFLKEAYLHYYYPIEGEFFHIDETFWNISKKEINSFIKAKRIRDNALKYAIEKGDFKEELKVLEEDIDLVLWEKLGKLHFSPLEENFNQKPQKTVRIKYKKLINIKDKEASSVIASIIESISQNLESHFPVRVAYTNYEIINDNKILIVPVAEEKETGIEFKIEITYNTPLYEEKNQIEKIVRETLASLYAEILKEQSFRPYMEVVKDEEAKNITIYVNWSLDLKAVEILSKKINKKWLFSRLFHRKKAVSRKNELLKILKEFTFTPENLSYTLSLLESLWYENSILLKGSIKEIREAIESKNLNYLILLYGLKCFEQIKIDSVVGKKELLQLLLSSFNFENIHHLLAETDRYIIPVITQRLYRPNWERVIKENTEISLTREVLNPQTPVTYTVRDENGLFLGEIPKIVAHYIAAKEESGYKIKSKKFYLDEVTFSDSSYWIEVKCVK